MKALVIGQGSIGQRHTNVLTELGLDVFSVSQHLPVGQRNFLKIGKAIAELNPDYVIIANRTSEHFVALWELYKAGFSGKILVEKPLFSRVEQISEFHRLNISVGYNLRYHPFLKQLKTTLKDQKICSSNAYVGQYLPNWRPQDYRKSYSANQAEGGGVLRDLSHELDYLLWFFGSWNRVSSIIGKFSNLEIDSEDTCSVLMHLEKCPSVTLEMNCHDRITQRWFCINTVSHSYKLDFLKGTLQTDDTLEHLSLDRNMTYQAMHKAILLNEGDPPCSLSEGLAVLYLIQSIEKSNLDTSLNKRQVYS